MGNRRKRVEGGTGNPGEEAYVNNATANANANAQLICNDGVPTAATLSDGNGDDDVEGGRGREGGRDLECNLQGTLPQEETFKEEEGEGLKGSKTFYSFSWSSCYSSCSFLRKLLWLKTRCLQKGSSCSRRRRSRSSSSIRKAMSVGGKQQSHEQLQQQRPRSGHFKHWMIMLAITIGTMLTIIASSELVLEIQRQLHFPGTGERLSYICAVLFTLPMLGIVKGILSNSNSLIFFGVLGWISVYQVLSYFIFVSGSNSSAALRTHSASEPPTSPFPYPLVSVFVLSLPHKRAVCRRYMMETKLEELHIPVKFIDALDIANYKYKYRDGKPTSFTGVATIFHDAGIEPPLAISDDQHPEIASADPATRTDNNGRTMKASPSLPTGVHIVMYVSMIKSMKEAAAQSDPNCEWLLVLEDDAALPSAFPANIQHLVASVPGHVDVIWLDIRTYASYAIWGTFPCCNLGMMYRKSSIPKILREFSYDSEIYRVHHQGESLPSDVFLGKVCEAKKLNCIAKPYLAEANLPTSKV